MEDKEKDGYKNSEILAGVVVGISIAAALIYTQKQIVGSNFEKHKMTLVSMSILSGGFFGIATSNLMRNRRLEK